MLSGAGPGNVQYYKHKDILNIATALALQHYKYVNIINTAIARIYKKIYQTGHKMYALHNYTDMFTLL